MINSVCLMGRLTRDPESRTTTTGMNVASFDIAVNTGRDEVSYFACRAFKAQADFVNQYLTKGSQVVVLGRLNQERWEKDGQKRDRITVICNTVQATAGDKPQDGRPSGRQKAAPVDDYDPFADE